MLKNLTVGCFYFISDQYYYDFPDPYLMPNKAKIDGQEHNRPCFFALQDKNTGLYWVIPVSSKVTKYKSIVQKKISRYGRCDTILFGEILGQERAFLIQNMFPITENYFESLYVYGKDRTPVRVDGAFERKLLSSARRVIHLVHNNVKGLIFPDVLFIEEALLNRSNKGK